MTNVTIDLSNFKDRVGSRVKPDTYRVVVDDAELDTARSGNQMINLWFRIVGGDFDGATIVDRLVLTEKSMFRVVAFMQALGMKTPKKRLQLNLEKFKGQKLEITVEDGDPYNGRVKSEVRGYARVAKSEKAAPETPDETPAEETEEDTPSEAVSDLESTDSTSDQGEVDLDDLDNL